MAIIEPIIRPPSEAESFLLQVTVGCSANDCTFCGVYRNKPFAIQDFGEIVSDIQKGASSYPQTRKVFLLDGDALAMNNAQLQPVLERINEAFPMLTRISSYANGYNILSRADWELQDLYAYRLKLIYMGLESGNQDILDRCQKRSSVTEMIEAVHKAREAKIKSSVIVLLGLGGKKYSDDHIKDTITALNRMQPRYLSFLSLMVIPGTPLQEEIAQGDFVELNSTELLREAHHIIAGLRLKKTIFRCNHASNYLPLEGRFPKDKRRLLDSLRQALQGKVELTPEFLRGL